MLAQLAPGASYHHCFATSCQNIRLFVHASFWPINANIGHVKLSGAISFYLSNIEQTNSLKLMLERQLSQAS